MDKMTYDSNLYRNLGKPPLGDGKQTTNCRICGLEIVQDKVDEEMKKHFPFFASLPVTVCSECESRADQEYQRMRHERSRSERETDLSRMYGMPLIYSQTDINHPSFPRDKYHTVLNEMVLNLTAQIYLFGDSGKCKTRIAWLVTRAMYVTHGYVPRFESAGSISTSISAAWSWDKSDESYKQLVNRLSFADFLVIDDLGKERLTDRFFETIFTVIESRVSNQRPTLITSNHDAMTICDRWSDKTNGAALYRRIDEFYSRYNLNTSDKQQ